ncbi:MAG TPA: FAD-dependent oxidoreductase [Thermomicrobiales bacterium]|nr:FAD-dependent oxidoreductase [Thermomicrobiales bacterium]
MSHYDYLIVGGGMAADAAVRGIREVDPTGAIGLLGAEADPPYKRPPLSKALWRGKPLDRVWLDTAAQDVDLHLGRTAARLDLAHRVVVDDRDAGYTFGKLLLATGGAPRRLPFGGDRIIAFRTLADYRRLAALAVEGQRFAVIGGGFIGGEIAAALAMHGKAVTLVFPEAGIGARLFPPDLARFLNGYYQERGVEVLAGAAAVGLDERGERLALRTREFASDAEREIVVDGVVAGIGIAPNVELARGAGLAVDDGIVVDAMLRTSHPDVYAAGDVAECFSPALGGRRRVEHEDNATTMGRAAGRAMAGDSRPYEHLPFFYSDLFDLGYEAVGDVDARLETVADWAEPHRQGVVYYLADGRVRGVLLWNVWDRVDAARALIAAPGAVRPDELPGRIPAA